MRSRRRLGWLVVTIGMLLAGVVRADDGSWGSTYDLAEGPLYAVEENAAITLDRELLVLEDVRSGAVTAVFQFRNTTDRAVTVEAGFPVELDVALSRGVLRDGVLESDGEGAPIWMFPPSRYGTDGEIDPALLKLAGITLREGDAAGFTEPNRYVPVGELTKRRVEKKVPKKVPFAFSIEQDGRPVKVTSLVVETDPTARPPIVFHFRHQLVLAPRATSVVRVRYKSPTRAGESADLGALVMLEEFAWRYVLRTGATWKGAIGRLVLAVPLGGTCRHEAGWRSLGTWGGYRVLEQVAFEPTSADDIVCHWYRYEDGEAYGWGARWFDPEVGMPSVPWAEARRTPVDVCNIVASSQITRRADVYAEEMIVTGAPNTAEAAFDGLLETAWSEAAKVDIGEYLEVELTKPATGLRVMTGFIGALHPFAGNGADKKTSALYKNLWAYNARPAELELVAVDGARSWTLPVQDKRAVWNVFPILVPAGRYRLVVKATAKGKKWQDTSIAEVDFATGDAAWLEALRQDAFFAPFFEDGAPYVQPWVSRPPP